MINRRRFIRFGSMGVGALFSARLAAAWQPAEKPVVVSTWNDGMEANREAWKILGAGGRALDAVEAGVRVTEASLNCCVGLGANPDREGRVTLDASIMDEYGNCGAVAFLERIKHPISVARRVMEKTPHVMLVGEGAQRFAVAEGFPLESPELSDSARKAYNDWLKTSQYKPVVNIENQKGHGPFAPPRLPDGNWNHDTIGMLALDAQGNLSGSCTTSGMGFKMRGRLGDSPIIGAGLFVDNEVGACVATGLGEEVIRVAGSHLVVELMRQGYTPEQACRSAIERIIRRNGSRARDIQVVFLALNKKGQAASYAVQKGFNYAIQTRSGARLVEGKYILS